MSKTFSTETTPKLTSFRRSQLLARSVRLREQRGLLPESSYQTRVRFLTSDVSAFARPDAEIEQEIEKESSPLDMITSMSSSTFMMVRQVLHILEMTWVSTYFSGFVVAKLPFPLADRFKSMIHRGLSVSALPNAYVSSLSWFVLTMFGVGGLVNMILGAADSTSSFASTEAMAMDPAFAAISAASSSGTGMFGKADFGTYAAKVKTEKTELEMAKSHPILEEAEQSFLLKVKKPIF